MKKIILKKYISIIYAFADSSFIFIPENIIAHFLTDSHSGSFTKKWLDNDEWKKGGSELVNLEKRNDQIILSSAFDEESDDKFEFAVLRTTFLKILDEWEQALEKAKEYIVIEVFDNNDVHIYATDKVETN